MTQQEHPVVLGRLVAACWFATTLLLLRMATNGSFVAFDLDEGTGLRASLTVVIAIAAAFALVLAVILMRPASSRALVVSTCSALVLVPCALPLLAVNHFSAIALLPLGALTALLSIRAWRGLEPPVGGS